MITIIRVTNGYIVYYGTDLKCQEYRKGYAFSTIRQLTAFLLENEELLK